MPGDEHTAAQRRVFKAVASAVVGFQVGDDVVSTASVFLRHLPPRDRFQLSLLLRSLQLSTLLPGSGLSRFSELDHIRACETLEAWLSSRLLLRRRGAAVLKALSALATYSAKSSWSIAAYDGPWLGRKTVPVLPVSDLPKAQSEHTRGITYGHTVRAPLRMRSTVCVIGTGAGGASVLARLARNGVNVIGVELGGHPVASDFTQREAEMLPLLYREAGLRATADQAIGILQGKGLGGSTLHNTGLVYEPPPGVLHRWRVDHGFALDDGRMRRYVHDAFSSLNAVQIAEDAINPNNALLRRGATLLGWRTRVAMHNRAECCGCGYCMIGCAYNRKHNASLTTLPRAVRAGARLLCDARVREIRGRYGRRVVACELLDGSGKPTGFGAEIEAAVVIVAAGALDTPALLQRSHLGNDRVGANLRLHPAAVVSAEFPERVEAWRGLPQSVIVEEFATFMSDGHRGFIVIPNAGTAPGLAATLAPGLGASHMQYMQRYPYIASAAVLVHDEGGGVVRSRRDATPVPRYRLAQGDAAELRRGIAALARIYFAAGAQRVWLPSPGTAPVTSADGVTAAVESMSFDPHRVMLNSVHPQGSCAMGADAVRSATSPEGAVWGAHGVFVADASLFPTSVGVPPQVTVMALANAVADRVLEIV
jgi:choline dehydrogenase-like flavoprotein